MNDIQNTNKNEMSEEELDKYYLNLMSTNVRVSIDTPHVWIPEFQTCGPVKNIVVKVEGFINFINRGLDVSLPVGEEGIKLALEIERLLLYYDNKANDLRQKGAKINDISTAISYITKINDFNLKRIETDNKRKNEDIFSDNEYYENLKKNMVLGSNDLLESFKQELREKEDKKYNFLSKEKASEIITENKRNAQQLSAVKANLYNKFVRNTDDYDSGGVDYDSLVLE